MALRNRARMTISSFAGNVGSGDLTLGSSTAGYQSFDSAGVADQEVVTYCIEEGTLWELGTGTYTASGTVLARTDGNVIAGSSGAGTKVATFTTAATVFLTASAADFVSTSSANTFTANQTFPNTGLRIKDTGTNVLTLKTTDDYTADRTLTFVLGDSNRSLTLSGNATISGTNTGDQTITLTGDVTGSGTGSFATTIGAGKVTLANMADLAQWALIGRSSSPAGAPQAIATSQDVFTLLGSTSTANFKSNLSLTKSDVGLGNVENTALSGWAGSVNIATVGTITSGTWSGTVISPLKGGTGFGTYATGDLLYSDATNSLAKLAGNTTTDRKFLSQIGNGSASAAPTWETTIPIANGGTGAASATNAFNALAPTTTNGDTIYYNGTNNVRLAGSTSATKKYLTQTGNGTVSAAPAWGDITNVGTVASGTWEGSVVGLTYGGTGANLSDPNDDRIMFWDETANAVTWLAPNGYNVKIDGTTLYAEETWMVAASDETTALTTGNGKATFVFPYSVTVVSVGCYIHTASSSGNVTVDINKAGTSILSSVLTMSSPSTKSATTSTFVSPPVSYSANEEVRIDIDSAGTGAKGLKVWMIVRRTS